VQKYAKIIARKKWKQLNANNLSAALTVEVETFKCELLYVVIYLIMTVRVA
jgi:hypothetical protein